MKYIYILNFFILSFFYCNVKKECFASHVREEQNIERNFTVQHLFSEGVQETEEELAGFQAYIKGINAENAGDLQEARSEYYKAARLESPQGMLGLAKFSYKDGFLAEAMRWATLSYHTYGVLRNEPYPNAIKFFDQVVKDLAPEKKKKYKIKSKFSDRKNIKKNIYDFLTSNSFAEEINTYNILCCNTTEPFYDHSLAKYKRLFIIGLQKDSVQSVIQLFLSKSFSCPLNKTMRLSQEIALSKGYTEQEGLVFLSELLRKRHDKLKVLKMINTPESLITYADLLYQEFQEVDRKSPKYCSLLKKIIKTLESLQTPESFSRLGNIYVNHPFIEKNAYKKAFDYLYISEDPLDILNKAEIIRYGSHGEEPNPQQAKEILLSLKEEIEGNKKLDPCNRSLPLIYNNLGSIFQGLGDNDTAIEYYEKSGIEIAQNSLFCLYRKRGQFEKAQKILESIESVEAKINYYYVKYENQEISGDVYIGNLMDLLNDNPSPEEMGKIVISLSQVCDKNSDAYQDIKSHFLEQSHLISESERLLILGKLDMVDENYDRARLYLSKLVLASSAEAIDLFAKLDELDDKNSEIMFSALDDTDLSILTEESSTSDETLSDLGISLIEQENSGINSFDFHQDVLSVPHKNISFQRSKSEQKKSKEKRAREKFEKQQAKAQRKFKRMCENGELQSSLFPKENISDLTYVFFGGDEMRSQFMDLSKNSPKFKELLVDIREQPWAITGSGKPEVLKGYYKGYKGCISRRLNREDRFVYKVTGPGQLLILSLEGHYN